MKHLARSGLIVTLLLGAVGLVLACATGPKVETTVYERDDGVIVVETTKVRATVTAINAATRELTIKPEDAESRTLVASEAVVNFDQIRVGDVVHVVLIDQLAVSLLPGGAPPSVGEAAGVALAPVGAKPGAFVSDTVEITGTIVAIDSHEHTVTLKFVDGAIQEIKLGKHRDLSKVALGDSVRVELTRAVAISVTTPTS